METSVRFCRLSSAGWVKGLRLSLGLAGDWVAVARGEWRRERVNWRLRMRRPDVR